MYICVCMYTYAHNGSLCVYTLIYPSYVLLIINTGGRRCVGCLKLQVSFRKRATNNRALLRKITYKDTASYASSPPCNTEYMNRMEYIHHMYRVAKTHRFP